MTHPVGIVIRDGAVDGWVFDLPDCRAIGGTTDEVRSLLPAVIADHVLWLQAHGEKPDATDFDFDVIEEVSSDAEFAFEDDRQASLPDDIEAAARFVTYANEDLVSLTGAMPDALSSWKVPATAVRIDDRFPDVRSINDMVAHVGSAMSFHIRGVGDVINRVALPEGPATLQSAFETTLRRFQAFDAEERSGRLYTIKTPRGDAEWTARKAFRRIINHQRFHTREVQQRLAWLTLGVPEFLPASRE